MESRTRYRTARIWLLVALGLGLSARGALSPTLRKEIDEAARRSSLDPKLVRAIVQVESNFNHKAISPKGAKGLMQVMDSTAIECQIHDPYHVVNNLMGACACLRKLLDRYRGDVPLALAAYNAGPGNVEKYKGIPPFKETKNYVKRILALYAKFTRQP